MTDTWPVQQFDPEPPISRLALSSLILGILSVCGLLFFGPLAFALGLLARYRLKRDPQFVGKRLALVGLSLGTVASLVLMALLGLFLSSMNLSLVENSTPQGPVRPDGGIVVYQDPGWPNG